MTWLKPWDYQPPSPVAGDMGPFMLGCAVLRDLLNADLNFLSGTVGPQYANPAAYAANLKAYALSLTQNTFQPPLVPANWDYANAAQTASIACFTMLQSLPVSAGDENSLSVFMAWILGTGALPGGHPATVQNTGDGTNASTGQSAVVGPSIL